jgi:hypothetical protein
VISILSPVIKGIAGNSEKVYILEEPTIDTEGVTETDLTTGTLDICTLIASFLNSIILYKESNVYTSKDEVALRDLGFNRPLTITNNVPALNCPPVNPEVILKDVSLKEH